MRPSGAEELERDYDLVKATREVLFRWAESVPDEIYGAPLDLLAGQSMRDRHLHAAQCYMWWISVNAFREPVSEPRASSVADVRAAYAVADSLVERFLDRYGARLDERIDLRGPDAESAPARWILVHPITHEFHHKGQITIAARMSGHPTPDTDLVTDA